MASWQPTIDDPTNNGDLDDRVLCSMCGKEGTEEEPLVVTPFGEEICESCYGDVMGEEKL